MGRGAIAPKSESAGVVPDGVSGFGEPRGLRYLGEMKGWSRLQWGRKWRPKRCRILVVTVSGATVIKTLPSMYTAVI